MWVGRLWGRSRNTRVHINDARRFDTQSQCTVIAWLSSRVGVPPIRTPRALFVLHTEPLRRSLVMSARTAEELRSTKRKLSAELADITRHVKAARVKQKAAARAWELTGSVLRVVLAIHTFADAIVDPSIVFLKAKGRECHWGPRSDSELGVVIYAAYASASVDEITSIIDFDNPVDAPSLSVALSYVEQWRLKEWATSQNRKGVAPGTGAALDRIAAQRLLLPEHLRPTPWGTSDSSTARKRVSRWRRRWGGRIAKLRIREEVTADEMRAKASERSESVRSYTTFPFAQ